MIDQFLAIPVILISAFYIPFILFYIKMADLKLGRKRFYQGVLSVLENNQENNECIPQINMIYKKLSETFNVLSKNYRSAPDFLEDFLCRYDTQGIKRFKDIYKIEVSKDIRNRLVNILGTMQDQQPFSSLSSKEGNLLNMLRHAIDINNKDLGINTLHQLAVEVEILEGNIRTQSRRTQLSFVISALGVILTFFFGIVAFMQFLKG